MTHTEILEKVHKLLNDKIAIDGTYMDLKDLQDLQHLTRQVWFWFVAESNREYVGSIREFLKHLEDSIPTDEVEPLDDLWDKFYTTDFKISFGDKTVTLYNCADTFQDIQNMLEREEAEYAEK